MKKRNHGGFLKGSLRRKMCAVITLGMFLMQPLGALASVSPDQKAPRNQTPEITSKNGVEIVEITAPTQGGVSHNLYSKFNVSSNGLILNNSNSKVETTLAGKIKGNKNLISGPATIILNEVTGKNPSNLNGFIEVAGQKADVVIANPNGIVGNGFGFINANRAVLTTGKAVLGSNGTLDGFQVTKGQVTIEKSGANASNIASLDILSPSVNVTGPIDANQLNIVAGTNQVNYSTLNTQPITGTTNPQVAIDIGTLGGMYANKIYLVSTNQGVGVNSQGVIQAQNTLNLSSNGKISLSGSTWAGSDATIQAKDEVVNQGRLYTKGSLNIEAQGNLQNTNTGLITSDQKVALTGKNVKNDGAVLAGIYKDGNLSTTGDVVVNSGENVDITGTIIAGGNVQITAQGGLHNSGQINTQGNATIQAKTEVINQNKIYTKGNLIVETQGNLENSETGQLFSQKDMSLSAQNVTSNGTISTGIHEDGSFGNEGALQVTSQGTVALAGNITTAGNTNITAKDTITNNSYIYAKGNVNIETQGDLENTKAGIIASAQDTTITAKNLKSEGTFLSGLNQDWRLNLTGDITVNTSGDADITGNLTAGDNIRIIAKGDLNNSGQIYAQGSTKIQAEGNLQNISTSTETPALIASGFSTELTGQNITSNGAIGAGKLQDGTDGIMTGSITINGKENVVLSGNTGTSNGSITVSGSDVDLSAGKVVAGDAVEIKATQGNVNNIDGSVIAGNGLKVNADNGSIINQNGQLLNVKNAGTVLLFAGNTVVNNNGKIVSDGKVFVRGNDVINDNGNIIGKGATAIFMKNLTNLNAEGMIASDSTLLIYGNGTINNSGQIMSNDVLTINGDPTIANSGQIVSSKELNIWSSTLRSKAGLGAPTLLINGYNQALTYTWVPVWDGFRIHWIMQWLSTLPVFGAGFTAIDAKFYSIEGNTDEARTKLLELPLSFTGLKAGYKGYQLTETALKTAEELAVQTAKSGFKFDLQLFAKNSILNNGRVTVNALKSNPALFSGKSVDEIAQMLRNAGYDVTVQASTKSRSGAQIIKINNPGGGLNITQVQVSPGGGRHGEDPYVKISTNDQGIIKIVDGDGTKYRTNGKERATIIFTGGN